MPENDDTPAADAPSALLRRSIIFREGPVMDNGFEDGYVVYMRFDHAAACEDIEVPVAVCPSYEDARRAYHACGWLNDLVIRYHGDVGGSD